MEDGLRRHGGEAGYPPMLDQPGYNAFWESLTDRSRATQYITHLLERIITLRVGAIVAAPRPLLRLVRLWASFGGLLIVLLLMLGDAGAERASSVAFVNRRDCVLVISWS